MAVREIYLKKKNKMRDRDRWTDRQTEKICKKICRHLRYCSVIKGDILPLLCNMESIPRRSKAGTG